MPTRSAKADWQGEEINLIHASGEGFLLPNGLSVELFPDRPPLKVHGHFASYQGGVVAALGALSALMSRDHVGAESVDVSVQDAMLAVGAFALQRFGDGSLEHRSTRSFKYGGVLECADGYVELLTLEDRQWRGLVELIMLNAGLEAGIIQPTLFTIMVLMAVTTTVMASPLFEYFHARHLRPAPLNAVTVR